MIDAFLPARLHRLVAVALPEEMPVTDALEPRGSLKCEMGMQTTAAVVVNSAGWGSVLQPMTPQADRRP